MKDYQKALNCIKASSKVIVTSKTKKGKVRHFACLPWEVGLYLGREHFKKRIKKAKAEWPRTKTEMSRIAAAEIMVDMGVNPMEIIEYCWGDNKK